MFLLMLCLIYAFELWDLEGISLTLKELKNAYKDQARERVKMRCLTMMSYKQTQIRGG